MSPRKLLRSGGFTLVEILVACAVLAVLVVFVAQMVGSASSVTGNSRKRLDADDEARMAFDMMAGDFSAMIKRPDIDQLFVAAPGNDRLFFYSQAPAFSTNPASSNSQVALVGYMVTNGTGSNGMGTNGLIRAAAAKDWEQLSFTSLTTLAGTNNPAPEYALGLTNFHSVAPSVFRMEYVLLMRPGSVNKDGSTNGNGVFSKSNNPTLALGDVSSIIVAIAILDPTSRKIAPPDIDEKLAGLMKDADVTSGSSGSDTISYESIPLQDWQAKALAASGIPKAVTSQVRVYRRYFPIGQ